MVAVLEGRDYPERADAEKPDASLRSIDVNRCCVSSRNHLQGAGNHGSKFAKDICVAARRFPRHAGAEPRQFCARPDRFRHRGKLPMAAFPTYRVTLSGLYLARVRDAMNGPCFAWF